MSRTRPSESSGPPFPSGEHRLDPKRSAGILGGAPKLLRAPYHLLFPTGVRVWHFILVPAVGMGLFLALFHFVDGLVLPGLSPRAVEIYVTLRTVLISIAMAGTIAFLAIQYRTGYEAALQARNVELEATRDFLARIIEGSAEGIITLDADRRVTSWNAAAEAIYGWSAAEMLGDSLARLLPPGEASVAQTQSLYAELRGGTAVRDFECHRIRKDGKPITVSLTMAPIYDPGGAFAGTAGIVRDVTAIKEMERQLLERERLAAVGELAAVVAHEVRNPLAGIRGGCEILLEGYGAGDARHDIGVEIIHQVDRLTRTVHDLLLYARPKAMDPVPTDLHGLVERILHILRDDPQNARVEIVREFGSDVPPVLVDGRQMEQVLLNLALNAIQAMRHDGTLTVATRRVAGKAQVAIRDTGPGIPPEQVENIFKPFFTTRAQGTGLGLAIVKRIVDAHGGSIVVDSPPGGGAAFILALPTEA